MPCTSPYVSSQTFFLFHSSYKQSWVCKREFCSPDFDFELVAQWHQLIVTPVQKSLFLWHETLHKRWGTRKPQDVLLCEAFKSLLVWRRDSVCYSICTHITVLSGEDIHCRQFWGHSLYLFHLILDYICYGISLLILKLREQYDTRELVVHDCYFQSWVNEMRWNEIR
jgi:hypothetical protein